MVWFLAVSLVLLLVAIMFWATGGQTVYATPGSGIIEAVPDALEAVPPPPSGCLVILSFSLAYGLGPDLHARTVPGASVICDRLDRMIETIVASGADIALLQEVDFASQRTYDIDELYYIGAALGWGYAARAVTWECRYHPWPLRQPGGRLRAGIGVISRYPLIQNVRHHLPLARAHAIFTSRFKPRHTVQMVDVQCGGTSIRLFNAALDHHLAASGSRQIQALASFVRDAYTPTSVLMGALNPSIVETAEPPSSLLMTELGSQFQAVTQHDKAAADTTGHLALHQAFVGRDLRPLDVQWLAMDTAIAEHAPLALHLRWALAMAL
jgi:endonuclease/exonuclease/phosphatase family metal-dependent hydrolase